MAYDDEDDEAEPLARKFRLVDLLVIPLAVATDISDAITSGFELLLKAVVADDNWRIEQANFRDAVREQIESLPQE